jgi:hypothetical protein
MTLSGVSSGTDFAMIDLELTIDPAFANDYTLELTSLDLPNVSTVPEVQPIALVGAVCLLGLVFGPWLNRHRARAWHRRGKNGRNGLSGPSPFCP